MIICPQFHSTEKKIYIYILLLFFPSNLFLFLNDRKLLLPPCTGSRMLGVVVPLQLGSCKLWIAAIQGNQSLLYVKPTPHHCIQRTWRSGIVCDGQGSLFSRRRARTEVGACRGARPAEPPVITAHRRPTPTAPRITHTITPLMSSFPGTAYSSAEKAGLTGLNT